MMRRDLKLVELFLVEFNRVTGKTYEVREWPDDIQRQTPAVDAIAADITGNTLAIEHTLLQPFVGEREDYERLRVAIEPLEQDESLRLPNYYVTLSAKVGAIPRGVSWTFVREKIRQWCKNNMHLLPEGCSDARIGIGPIEIELRLDKAAIPNTTGRLLVARNSPPGTFQEVVRQALKKKLSKLANTKADKRILLLEREVPLYSPNTLTQTIEALSLEFAKLTRINVIWLADTIPWEREGCIGFGQVWPPPTRTFWRWHKVSPWCIEQGTP